MDNVKIVERLVVDQEYKNKYLVMVLENAKLQTEIIELKKRDEIMKMYCSSSEARKIVDQGPW